jgi:6-phosphogluconolactonase
MTKNSEPQIEVLADKAAITARALAILLNSYQEAIAARGRFTLVAAGGSTPKMLYEALANQQLDWSKVHVFWGDERYVLVSDSQSNQGMTRKAWLDLVEIPEHNIHPMPTDADDPAEAAQAYQRHLLKFFAPNTKINPENNSVEFPEFDLILLGIGDDGHTASLFPHTAALSVSDRLITVGTKDGDPRITFTYHLINQARQILFLAEGTGKAKALAAILSQSPEFSTQEYPAKLIQGKVTWLIDPNAAQLLPKN